MSTNIQTLVEDEVRQEILYPFVDKCQEPSLYVELGVFLGGNLYRVADRARSQQKNIRMFGIDNWEFFNNGLSPQSMDWAGIKYTDDFEAICKQNLQEFSNVTIVSGDTNVIHQQFADNSIDCLFIDALHTHYEYHINEIQMWLPKVKDGGLVTGHDWPTESIQQAVKHVFKDKNIFVCSSNGGYMVVK